MDRENSKKTTMKIVEHFGNGILSNPQLFISCFKDFAPKLKDEAVVMDIALKRCAVNRIFEQPSTNRMIHIKKALSGILSTEGVDLFCDCIATALNWNESLLVENIELQKNCVSSTIEIEITDSWEQYKMGYNYAQGANGYKKDLKEAFKWFMRSAQQGNSWAENAVGSYYRWGRGIPINISEALKWFRRSAEHGDHTAKYNIGLCYYEGIGVEKNVNQAIKWYKLAAEQGLKIAQYALGCIYEFGKGVAVDYYEAVRWYQMAANQGDAWSQNRLGDCYRYGHGVRKDLKQAKYWYQQAAEQGDETAIENLKSI